MQRVLDLPPQPACIPQYCMTRETSVVAVQSPIDLNNMNCAYRRRRPRLQEGELACSLHQHDWATRPTQINVRVLVPRRRLLI